MSCSPISLITVQYGNELVLFKKAVLEEFDISLLKTIEFDKVITYQEQLFEVVLKYTHLLTFDKPNEKINYASHKNNYALMIALISDLSLSSDWTELLKQTQKYIVSFNTYDFDNFKEKRNCCCRQHCLIKNLFLMTNNYSGLSVYTGCDCIEKIIFCGVNDDIKEAQKKLKQRLETTRLLNLSYVNTLKKYEDRNKKVEELFKKNILKQKEFDKFKNNLMAKIFRAFYVNRGMNKRFKRNIIWQWKFTIQYKNNLRKKVGQFIYRIIKDKVDFPKVVREIGIVSYFRFVKKHSKTLKWKKYIDYLLEESSISQVKKNKIIQFLK
jgi:hypothetical protein